MSEPVPRLRVFAGPNGSGKSTIKEMLPVAWLGVYVNADEIEKTIQREGGLDLATFGIGIEAAAGLPDFLRRAREGGFRTYLYFVATEDPEINISRVQHRVRTGGHPVPTDKIVSRYHRSLDLLPQALAHTSRAYVFDNSGHERVLMAEVTDGMELEMKTEGVPAWFAGALGLDTPPEVTGV